MSFAAAHGALSRLAAELHSRGVVLPLEAGAPEGSELLKRVPLGEGRPWFVARPESVSDVQACVRCARELGATLSVVGGGHSPYSTRGRLVADLQNFSAVEVDPSAGTVTIGGGALARQILEATAEHRLAVPLGTAPTVGLGLVLQGGVGHLTRYRGLTLDRLISVRLVVADGRCVTASRDEHPDLFWALAGCGPNFGVVTSATLAACELRPLAVSRHLFSMPEAPAASARLLADYGRLSAALPRSASADCILHYSLDGKPRLGVYDYFLHGLGECVHECPPAGGGMAAAGHELLEEGLEPCVSASELFGLEPYLLQQPRGVLHPPGAEGLGFFVRAVFVPAPLPATVAEGLLTGLFAAPSQYCYVHLQHAGGAVADRAPAEAAFAARGLEWSVVVSGCWPCPDEGGHAARRAEEWVRKVVHALLPASLGTYATDLGPEDADLAPHAFGDNRAELLRLKRLWDPSNIFGCGFPLASGAGSEL